MGEGRGGEGEGGNSLYKGVVRMCGPNSPLFSARKVYEYPYFLRVWYMNGSFSAAEVYL